MYHRRRDCDLDYDIAARTHHMTKRNIKARFSHISPKKASSDFPRVPEKISFFYIGNNRNGYGRKEGEEKKFKGARPD